MNNFASYDIKDFHKVP